MRVAQLQRQVGLRREFLVLRTALIVLETVDDIGTDVGEIDAVEGDRRHAALILIRNKVDARRCQVAGAQNLFYEIIRMEEGRVGKASDRTCKVGWAPLHKK